MLCHALTLIYCVLMIIHNKQTEWCVSSFLRKVKYKEKKIIVIEAKWKTIYYMQKKQQKRGKLLFFKKISFLILKIKINYDFLSLFFYLYTALSNSLSFFLFTKNSCPQELNTMDRKRKQQLIASGHQFFHRINLYIFFIHKIISRKITIF